MVVLGLEQTVVAVKIYNIAMMALYIRPIIAVQTDFFPKKNKLSSEPQNGRVKRKFSNNFGQVCVLARQHFYYYFLFLS